MLIREIEARDNKRMEEIIRACLTEFGGNREGLAWEDPQLGSLYDAYQDNASAYWVVEKDGGVVGGCGIAPLEHADGVCELQKMYCLQEARGTGAARALLHKALEYASRYYHTCYLETLSNMEAANKFYLKNGFKSLEEPMGSTGHYSCDVWYAKSFER